MSVQKGADQMDSVYEDPAVRAAIRSTCVGVELNLNDDQDRQYPAVTTTADLLDLHEQLAHAAEANPKGGYVEAADRANRLFWLARKATPAAFDELVPRAVRALEVRA